MPRPEAGMFLARWRAVREASVAGATGQGRADQASHTVAALTEGLLLVLGLFPSGPVLRGQGQREWD